MCVCVTCLTTVFNLSYSSKYNHVCVCAYVCMCSCACVCMCICTCVCVCVCACVCACVCVCVTRVCDLFDNFFVPQQCLSGSPLRYRNRTVCMCERERASECVGEGTGHFVTIQFNHCQYNQFYNIVLFSLCFLNSK